MNETNETANNEVTNDEIMNDEISFVVDIKHLRTVTTAISELKKDAKKAGKAADKKTRTITFECHSEFIRIKDIDDSKVLAISMDLDKEFIEEYENNIDENKPIKVIIDLDKLIESISEIEGVFNFNIDLKNKHLQIWSDIYSYRFSFKVDKTEVKLPTTSNKSYVELSGEQLFTYLKKCSNLHRYVIISAVSPKDDEHFMITFVSKEEGTNNSITVKLDEFNVVNFDGMKEDVLVKIDTGATNLIDLLRSTIKNAKVVKLLIENNKPVMIDYQIIEGHGDTKIMIAPRNVDE